MNERERNRARFPELAAIVDSYGPDCRLRWAQDEAGEIGKKPADEPGVSAEFLEALRAHNTYHFGGRRRK
jgi:hypothetical protein